MRYAQKTISASAKTIAVPARVMAVSIYVPTNVNGKVEFFDSTDGSGTAVHTLGVGGVTNGFGGSFFENMESLGGIPFSTCIYCAITGSGVLVTYWYDPTGA